MGNNEFGQLGIGDKDNRHTPVNITQEKMKIPAIEIGAGGFHTFCHSCDGAIYSWGLASRGI
jgi:alpha-tubulin suppressor-like RCC1 family protein